MREKEERKDLERVCERERREHRTDVTDSQTDRQGVATATSTTELSFLKWQEHHRWPFQSADTRPQAKTQWHKRGGQDKAPEREQESRALAVEAFKRRGHNGRTDTPLSPPRILNKLTVEKFALLSRQLLGLGLHSETILKGVIALIFHKAIHEPQFAELYARVC